MNGEDFAIIINEEILIPFYIALFLKELLNKTGVITLKWAIFWE